MPRSGGTLLYQLTKEIAEQANLCKGRGFAKERYKNGVVKADFCHPWMIERIKNGAIAFGSYRDFRDIIVSLRGFYNRRDRIQGNPKVWTIQNVLNHRSEILDVYYCWQKHATWIRYEGDNFAERVIDMISGRLDLPLIEQQKRAIIKKYNLKANIKRTKTQKVWMEAGRGSMLTKGHVSPTRGKSTWHEVLSNQELVIIEKIGDGWLREHGYK